MPNNYLSVLYKNIIQVEIKNVRLKVCGGGHTIAPQSKKCPPPPPLPTPVIYITGVGSGGGWARGACAPPLF